MVQRKVPSKLGIQADHHHHNVKYNNKRLANLNPDGKTRGGADLKKKMKKSKPIKLSDMEILKKSSPSKKSFSQPLKPPPSSVQVHHPTVSPSSPQKQTPLIRTSDGSPNYMKPTSSSDAKKELFPVSLRSSKSNCKSSSVSTATKKPAKTLTKLSPSLKLVRTLTKTPSFKKSSKVSLCADMNSQRATCSSILKDSKFPPYLMLNPGATESEGTSAMKVCPYTYCSLNGHRHVPLPPLKSFLSASRHLLKTQKSMKMEALSPRKLKVPCEPKKESDADMDFFIEIYAKKNWDEEEIGQMGPTKRFEDAEKTQGDDDDDMMQVVASLSDGSPKSEIDSEEDYGKYFDDDAEIEAVSKGSFVQEREAEFSDEKHLPIWSNEEISIGRYCSEVSYEGEMYGSDSVATDMEWDHEEDDADSSVLTEDNDSKVESLSESSHDVSVMWLDDIINIYYDDIVAEVSQESNAKGSICFEESLDTQEGNGGENEIVMDATVHCSDFTEKTFEELEETGKQNQENNDVSEAEQISDEQENKCLQQDDSSMSHADRISDASQECYKLNQVETEEDVAENHFSPEEEPLIAETNNKMEEEEDNTDFKEETVGNFISDSSQDCCEASEDDNSRGQKASESWKWAGRLKRLVEDEDEMRKFNPRDPNFLPLVPNPEGEKVDLKHQMMDERKNAEEWMLDYALRQTVTKLAPARKRKVALLVEAFESVIPMPKCETHIRNRSSFSHPRPIQACS